MSEASAHEGASHTQRLSLAERILAVIAASSLFGMMALTFAGVVARYFLDRPIAGDGEIQAFLLGLVIFSALPLVTRAQRHIAVRAFAAMLRGRALFAQRIFVLAATSAGFAFIGYFLLVQAETLGEEHITTNYLDIPEAPFAYLFTAFTWAAALAALGRLVALWRGGDVGSGPRAEEASPE